MAGRGGLHSLAGDRRAGHRGRPRCPRVRPAGAGARGRGVQLDCAAGGSCRGRRHLLAVRQRLRPRHPGPAALARLCRRAVPDAPARRRAAVGAHRQAPAGRVKNASRCGLELLSRRQDRRRSFLGDHPENVPLLPKRVLVGQPLRSDRMAETLLPKRLALPVFCSDPLSSVAYATEQIILVLGLGGLALLHLTPWLGLAVVVLLVIVVASYRQTCFAYPNGGGAYTVSKDNLGPTAALVAASALLVDY